MLQTAPTIKTIPTMLRLDFEDLTAFERVSEQYRHLGVHFNDAIAFEPSNPAFLPKSGSFVLMPLGHKITLNVSFDHPTCWVGAYVCGAGSIILTALDRSGNIIAQVSTNSAVYARPSNLKAATRGQQLELNRRGIAKVIFHSTQPFILDDFFFSCAAIA